MTTLLVPVPELIGIALQAAFVVGCTAVIGKLIPDQKYRAVLLPLIALALGVIATTAQLWLPSGMSEMIFQGVALGGSATGLYVIKKENDAAKLVAAAASAPDVTVNPPQ